MIRLDPSFVTSWLRSLGLAVDPSGEAFAYVATLRLAGARGGWLEVDLPESAVRHAAARQRGVPLEQIDDVAAFDGATHLLQELRASLPGGRSTAGEPTIALRATRPGQTHRALAA